MIRFMGDETTEYQKSVQICWDKICDRAPVDVTSSGTTGKPKNYLIRDVRSRKKGIRNTGHTWLFSYPPTSWAGVSLLTHVAESGDHAVIPKSLGRDDLADAIKNCSAISVTPTRFRNLWWSNVEIKHLTQITFGGEYTTQSVIDLAKDIAPRARITHSYASAELGDIISCSDGKEGYPAEKFLAGKILMADGELIVGTHKTGDMWALKDGRYHFIGRKSNIANVGGNKVSIETIEQIVNAMAGVKSARCQIFDNPMTGQAIKLEYIGTTTEREIRHTLLRNVPKYQIPAIIEHVSEINQTDTGKIQR